MIWSLILISFLSGIIIGTLIMYYKDKKLLNNQKFLYDELQINKIKLNKYQTILNDHFNDNIKLLNQMAETHRELYHNIKKSASFLLPQTYVNTNSSISNTNKLNTKNEPLSIEAPLDYSENNAIQNTTQSIKQNKKHIKCNKYTI